MFCFTSQSRLEKPELYSSWVALIQTMCTTSTLHLLGCVQKPGLFQKTILEVVSSEPLKCGQCRCWIISTSSSILHIPSCCSLLIQSQPGNPYPGYAQFPRLRHCLTVGYIKEEWELLSTCSWRRIPVMKVILMPSGIYVTD